MDYVFLISSFISLDLEALFLYRRFFFFFTSSPLFMASQDLKGSCTVSFQ